MSAAASSSYVADVITQTIARNPGEPEFHQAVQEVLESLAPVFERRPELRTARILERMVEPERVIMFRVPWQDDRGEIHINLYRPKARKMTEDDQPDEEVLEFYEEEEG